MIRRTTKKSKPNAVTKRLKKDRSEHKARSMHLSPSPEAATNVLLAGIIVRSASSLFHRSVERRVARANAKTEAEVEKLLGGRSAIRTMALYGASKLATRSPLGLGVVAGSLALKTLYDRGKARQRRLAEEAIAQEGEQSGPSAP